jgi:hypothetical protein
MAAISWSIARGVDGFKNSDFTVGTLAPNANDFEFRYNKTDANSKNINMKDALIALKAFIRAVETGGTNVDISLGFLGPPS